MSLSRPWPVRRRLRWLLVIFGLIGAGGCDVLGPPNSGPTSERDHSDVQITYVASGGFGGGVLAKLTITEDGLVTDSLRTPLLHLQLTHRERAELDALFAGFFGLEERYDGQLCADDVYFTVTYRRDGDERTVSASGCTLSHAVRGQLKQFERIVRRLSELGQEVYEEKAPWRGLEAEFSIERDTYGVGESMTFLYRIVNPTDKVRTLYFPYEERLNFRVYRPSVPGFDYVHVEQPDSTALSSISLNPGEETTLRLEWNQAITTAGEPVLLEPGRYSFVLSLLDTSHLRGDEGIQIDVVDRAEPLSGFVTGRGEDSSVLDYTFQLHVRNWTLTPVTLEFAYEEKIYVELLDLDRPEPGPLLFQGPSQPTSDPSSLVLQPGETHVFEYTVPKADLNLTYYRYLARVKLLSSNVELHRESQLRISKPRP